jgi:uncharacterized membrane protein YcaP (DUF421 family)
VAVLVPETAHGRERAVNWSQLFFDGWAPLVRTLVVGACAYVALVLLLRTSGKRTLSKFNAFDFVVTVALGSTLATVLLSQRVSLAQGATAFVVLIVLQLVVTWLSVRSARVRAVVKGEPTLLLHRGEFLEGTLRRERVTRDEVLAALRSQGVAEPAEVEAAVLETDGSITVVAGAPRHRAPALADARGYRGG